METKQLKNIPKNISQKTKISLDKNTKSNGPEKQKHVLILKANLWHTNIN